MKKRQAVCGAAFFLANLTASPAQTDPGLSTKPAGVTLSGERIGPEKPPVDLSRPEPEATQAAVPLEGAEFFEAALRGEAWAQTKLGKIYVAAPDDAQLERGVTLLGEAAAQHDAEAIYFLATLSAVGHGVEQSDLNAFEQMKRAAELGFAEAQFALGTMYFKGSGTNQDEAAAIQSFLQAAKQGHIEAMFASGRILLAKPNPEQRGEGLALMGRAIASGHIEATLMLATAYGRGSIGMPKDEAQAEAILKPAAERGDADCQMALASLYKFGDSFAERRALADDWLQRAAEQGQPRALEILASGEP